MDKNTSSNDGSASLIGTSQLLFSVAGTIGSFRPEIGYTIFARKPSDGSYSSKLMIFQLPYLMTTDFGTLKFGPTLWMHSISGSGGNIVLSNGTGTSTFSKPGNSSTSKTLGVLAGYYLPVSDSLGLDLDLDILSPLSKRRSFNLLAQLSWSVL
jgi:hypothetical protein